MIKKLATSGNTWHIYLPKPMLQLLRFDPEKTKVLFTVKNKILYITKITEEEVLKLDNPLVKNLVKKGCGHVIMLSQPVLELIDINPEIDFVDIEVEEQTLIIRKAAS